MKIIFQEHEPIYYELEYNNINITIKELKEIIKFKINNYKNEVILFIFAGCFLENNKVLNYYNINILLFNAIY